MKNEWFVLLLVILPLLSSLVLALSRNKLNYFLSKFIACHSVFLSFLFALYLFFFSTPKDVSLHSYYSIVKLGNGFSLEFNLMFDHLSSLFVLIITGIGYLIHLFSTEYMHEESKPDYARYFSYLNLFIFFMLLLVMGGNYFITFIGWEGVGLCSYLLIGYWFTNEEYIRAGKKAFVMNRIGDAALLLAMFWLISKLNNLNYNQILATATLTTVFTSTDITILALLIFIGAVGKSAQIPLFTWLPDAMAGPTPVSALIHAATMVTAGIYIIIRSQVLFDLAPFIQNIILIIGLTTMLVSASIALKQNDIKKILAYSTVSQLGYMFMALGLGMYSTSFFHVLTHAFFKALLFLGAGSVILSLHHQQNIFKMGGLKKVVPLTHICFLIGCLAIAGLPPFSGFFSKDQILAGLYNKHILLWGLGVVGAFLTSTYIFRLYFKVFQGNLLAEPSSAGHNSAIKEGGMAIKIPLILLAIGSTISGFWGIPEALGGKNTIAKFLNVPALDSSTPLSHSLELMLMGLSVTLALIGLFLGKYLANNTTEIPKTIVGNFLLNKWYWDEFYNKIVVIPYQQLSIFLFKIVDLKIVDGFINFLIKQSLFLSRKIRLLQTGNIASYLLVTVIAMYLFFLVWFNDSRLYNFFVQLFK